MNKKKEMTICLGSSCFSRGNSKNLKVIQEYLKNKGLEAEINFKGQLCSENCLNGPMLIIDGKQYDNVTQQMVLDILDKEFNI